MKTTYDLTKIWKMQKELDKAILSSRNTTYEKTFSSRSLAYLVELAEFANEVRDFKYWSNKKASARDILIEEYIDGIHFIVAQGIYFSCKEIYEVEKSNLDGVELTIEVFKLASQITKNSSKEFVEKVLTTYLQLAIHYNFSPEDLNTHYVKKNEINYQRIKDNY